MIMYVYILNNSETFLLELEQINLLLDYYIVYNEIEDKLYTKYNI